MNQATRNYNKRIDLKHREESFGRRFWIAICVYIFIGLFIALASFILSIRLSEQILRHF